MVEIKTLILIVVVAGLIIGVFFWKTSLRQPLTTETPEGIITFNPFFETEDYFSWFGNFGHNLTAVPPGTNHYGIVIIHPIDNQTPSIITQRVDLPEGNLVLKASVGNIAGLTDFAGSCGDCADVIIQIKIYDYSTRTEETLFDDVVKPSDGWVELSYDISRYSGKPIEFKAFGIAGGPCSNWCGEWAALDYFYIEKIG
jgi:hypothetical protein